MTEGMGAGQVLGARLGEQGARVARRWQLSAASAGRADELQARGARGRRGQALRCERACWRERARGRGKTHRRQARRRQRARQAQAWARGELGAGRAA